MRIPASMSNAARLVTAGELEKFPTDDRAYELVEGRLIPMSPVGPRHGQVVIQLGSLLNQHIRARNLGALMTEVGFTLATNPDTVRAPDLALLRQNRQLVKTVRGFWKGSPDLVVEVLSPDDASAEVRQKVQDYLSHGVPLVLVVDPEIDTVTLYRPSGPSVTLGSNDVLDLGDDLDGFRCRVREIFE